ncbi:MULTISPECIES: TVP38/TMEM64 family protein [Shouchella]|uniref:TVP38/TMEM64 family membrane protein n=2 Tax=Shouchella TaxID=2893057 RepID=A0ABY7W2F1_9BACI|nr:MULTISPECIES: TVP38/TMEM64 family protein [Shouchella]MED4127977.1 TVP38/TMEM64 family protein [Shouchella miscanthi]WDF03122.1 TVP38/TMEM64 family protein [Shouchella hunanensis]
MKKKIIVSIFLVGLGTLVFMYQDRFLNAIETLGDQSIILTTLIATLLSLFPVIPYPLIGGLIGAAYGPYLGSLVTWLGSSIASILFFTFIRYGYQDIGLKMIHRYQLTSTITRLFEKNAFMTIFITRLIPIIPSILVNAYSALSRVSPMHYIVASSLGKVPSMILFATVGHALFNDPQQLMIVILYYLAFLLFVYGCYRLWLRTSRYKKEI